MGKITTTKIFLFITLILSSCFCVAQTYSVQSLDGKNQKVYVDADGLHEILTISCLEDTFHIKSFYNIVGQIKVLNGTFLLIKYVRAGGSGLHIENTLMVCVNKHHIVQSFHVLSTFKEEFIDFSKKVDSSDPVEKRHSYILNFNLNENEINRYIVKVKIHETETFKQTPSNNYSHDTETVLNFDLINFVFYNKEESLSQYFTIFDPKSGDESKRYIMATVPAILFGNYEYYYIKGEWYECSDKNYLAKYSYK